MITSAPSTQELEAVDRMNEQELDDLPFGAIRLDHHGVVLSYNATEAKLTGRDPRRVIGKNFFTQVAPCTNNRLMFGKFKDGLAKGELDNEFNYTFTYKMKPTNVVRRAPPTSRIS